MLGAGAISRALVGGAFPLFTTYMFRRLGIHWASSIPAFLEDQDEVQVRIRGRSSDEPHAGEEWRSNGWGGEGWKCHFWDDPSRRWNIFNGKKMGLALSYFSSPHWLYY